MRVYRNCSKPAPPLEPKEEREVFIGQWDALQEFFAHWEKDSEGNFAGTCSNYRDLQEFEELFREHFRDFFARRVEREAGRKDLGGGEGGDEPPAELRAEDDEQSRRKHPQAVVPGRDVTAVLEEHRKHEADPELAHGDHDSGEQAVPIRLEAEVRELAQR
jgi:hypothetical protein